VPAPQPDIGTQIRKAREALDLSQVSLAIQAGYAERSIQSWESGERTPRLQNLMHLAEVLQQEVAYFYGSGSPDQEPNGDEVAA
jgi:transcriptional regulator with XRE-family HTH domain